MDIFYNPEKLQEFMSGMGYWAPALFFLLQILQVVIAPIPGNVTTLVGGAMFGFLPAFFLSSLAVTVSGVICFLIGRKLGVAALKKLLKKEQVEKYEHLLSASPARLHVFVILFFLFPFLPKDLFCYLVGLTPMRLRVFTVITVLTRPWGLLTAALLGSGTVQLRLWIWVLILVSFGAAGIFAFRYAEQMETKVLSVIHRIMQKRRRDSVSK